MTALLLLAAGASHADCARAQRNYETSRNSMRPDLGMVQRAYDEMADACGYAPQRFVPAAPPQPPEPPRRTAPGSFVNCDQAGCWGANNGVRYNFVAGGHLQGTNGSFCALGAGNMYSCN